jgi:hypothetical protein
LAGEGANEAGADEVGACDACKFFCRISIATYC